MNRRWAVLEVLFYAIQCLADFGCSCHSSSELCHFRNIFVFNDFTSMYVAKTVSFQKQILYSKFKLTCVFPRKAKSFVGKFALGISRNL